VAVAPASRLRAKPFHPVKPSVPAAFLYLQGNMIHEQSPNLPIIFAFAQKIAAANKA
jgi:hypothetical protein